MDEVPDAREITTATVAEMVRAVDPELEVQRATPADRGFCSVFEVVADDGDRTRRLYLKASPDGKPWGIPDEARVQAVLDARTSIPVPEVLGVVDDRESLPTPFYLMTALPGDELPYERVCRLGDDALERLARETGAYLGELHSVPGVERFGHVRHDGPELAGERPAGDPATLTVGEPRESWSTYLREYVDRELERHADSQFSELTPELTRFFETGIGELDGPFEPVLGRNDHGLHNLLVAGETGEITAMLDWGYTLAVAAAFDVEFAVYILSGAFLAGAPDVADRRPLVREALLSGYRASAPDRVDAVATPAPLYEALAAVRIMNDFRHLDLPEGTETAVMDYIKSDVRRLLDRGGSDRE